MITTPLQPTLHPPTTNTIHDSTIPTPLLTPLPTHFDSQYASPSLPANEPEPSIPISMKLHQSLILFNSTLLHSLPLLDLTVYTPCVLVLNLGLLSQDSTLYYFSLILSPKPHNLP